MKVQLSVDGQSTGELAEAAALTDTGPLTSPSLTSCERSGRTPGIAASVMTWPPPVVIDAPLRIVANASSANIAAACLVAAPLYSATAPYHPPSELGSRPRSSPRAKCAGTAAAPRMFCRWLVSSIEAGIRSSRAASSSVARPPARVIFRADGRAGTPRSSAAGSDGAVRFITPYPPSTLGRSPVRSHRVSTYDTASSTTTGTPNSRAAARICAIRTPLAAPELDWPRTYAAAVIAGPPPPRPTASPLAAAAVSAAYPAAAPTTWRLSLTRPTVARIALSL